MTGRAEEPTSHAVEESIPEDAGGVMGKDVQEVRPLLGEVGGGRGHATGVAACLADPWRARGTWFHRSWSC